MTERGGGRWRLQVTGDPDPVTGEQRRLSRTMEGTRSDARQALQRMVVEAGAGLVGGATSTVATLLEAFMTTATLAPTTRQDRASVVTNHLLPSLGDMPLWKLTARDCDQLYARMAAAGSGPSRVRCAHVVLHRAVAQAVRWGWVARNPVSAATRPPVPRTTITPPGAEDVRGLLAAAEGRDPVLACWLQIAVATGARRGEVCALRWSDVDLGAATVRIERSVSATKIEGVAIRATKTGQVRLVALTAQAVNALVCQRTRAERRRASAGGESMRATRSSQAARTPGGRGVPSSSPGAGSGSGPGVGLPTCAFTTCAISSQPNCSRPASTSGPSPTASATPAPPPPSTSTGRGSPPATATPPNTSSQS
jgi:integrase